MEQDQKIIFEDSSGIKMQRLKNELDRRVQKISRMVSQGFKKRKKKSKSKSKQQNNNNYYQNIEGIQQGVQTQVQLMIQSFKTPNYYIQRKQARQISTVQSQKQYHPIGINTQNQIKKESNRYRKLTLNTTNEISIEGKSGRARSPMSISISQGYNQNQKVTRSNTFNQYQSQNLYNKNNKNFQKQNQESEEQNIQIAINEENLEFQDSLDQDKYQSSIKKKQSESSPMKQKQIDLKLIQKKIEKVSELSNSNLRDKRKLQKVPSKQKLQKQNDLRKSISKNNKSRQPTTPKMNKNSSSSPTKNLVNTKNNIQRSSKKIGLDNQIKKQRTKHIKTQAQQQQSFHPSFENDCNEQDFNSSFLNGIMKNQIRSSVDIPSFTIKNQQKIVASKISTDRRKLTQQKTPLQRLSSPQKTIYKTQKKVKQQKIAVSSKVKQQMQNLVKNIIEKPRRQGNDSTVRANLLKRIQQKNIKK